MAEDTDRTVEPTAAELLTELEAERSKSDSYLDLAKRAQADFANYKRRVERERVADAIISRANTVTELLPLLDDLDLAIGHLPADLTGHSWAKGVALIGTRLQTALERLGVERIGEPGQLFDPNLHEAVAQSPRHDVEPDHVAEIVRYGYRSGDRLLRPAQVVVATAPTEGTADEDTPGEEDAAPPHRKDGVDRETGTRIDKRI